MGSKINSVISWGRPKQKLKTTAPRGSLWRDWRNPKGSHALPFFFIFGCIERKWGVSDPLENTSGQRWCLPRVKILGAVPLEEIFLLADSTLLGNRARTLHLQTYLSHAYVNMSPSFLSSLPNSYPRRFLFSFQDNFIISILDI